MSTASRDALVADIVSANVRNLATTTDKIIEHLERQIRDLAETVVLMDEILTSATVIDRATEARLLSLSGRIDAAHRTLDRLEDHE